MYNSANKQYIFRQSSGKVWNFFCEEKLGLCYSTLTRRNTWTEPILVQKNIHFSFCADMDDHDNFHILYQDRLGNIFYCKFHQGTMTNIPILNSKQPSPYDKHFFLIPGDSLTHIFFTIHHNDTNLLGHQIITGDTAGKPKVIDYVPKTGYPYTITVDRSGNIYAFYQSSDGKYMQTGYKKYMQAQNFWGEFTPITRFSGDTEFTRVIVDSKDILHLCYQRLVDKQYQLVYQQKVPDRNLWSAESVIHESTTPFDESSILYVNDSLLIFWVRNDIIFYSKSIDGGSLWSKPGKYNFPLSKQLLCITYKTNHAVESDKIFSREIPGSFVNGFKLAFYEEPAHSPSNLSPDDLRNMIVDSLKLLKTSVDELKDASSSMQGNISQISLAQQSLEREITKYSVRLSLLENEVNQIKALGRQIDSYKNSLDELKTSFAYSRNQPSQSQMGNTLEVIESKGIPKVKGFKLSRNIASSKFIKKISE